MSSRIRVLDEDTINKIAAGEVIENPSSVVKELVENSLDAGSTEIAIEIKGGGRQLIRITDNGSGMNQDDALLCLERHATSKLREIEDIHSIGTMGFRGEAIPSIASISKFTLYTRLSAPEYAHLPGTLVIVNGGKLLSCSPVECALGTTIEIKDLFFNVPVRKKFQKSPSYDVAEIHKMVNQLALGNPRVQFKLISNQEVLVSVQGSSSSTPLSSALAERIRQLLGHEMHGHLIPLQGGKEGFQIEGFIGLPLAHRHNRSGQHLFINNRGVAVPLISFAIKDGYGTMLPSGRHPIFVLHFTLPKGLLDVNVHPQKREIRLRQERMLKEMVIASVESALRKENFSTTHYEVMPEANVHPFDPLPSNDVKPSTLPSHQSFSKNKYSAMDDPFLSCCEEAYQRPNFKLEESITPEEQANLAQKQEPTLFAPLPAVSTKEILQAVAILEKYIIATNDTASPPTLCLVDQRAAHERVIFEKMNSQQAAQELQMLLIPQLLNLSPYEANLLRTQLAGLQSTGIHIKEFGPTTFMIEALPQSFGNVDIHKLIDEILKSSYEGVDVTTIEKEQKRKIASAASQAAISAGMRLSLIEAQQLLNQLMQCQNFKQCPNGRPTFISLTAKDIAKLNIGHK